MQTLGSYSQKDLDDIWDSLDSDSPYPETIKVVDDDQEQTMTINKEDGQVAVSRKPGEEWHDTPSVNDDSIFA